MRVHGKVRISFSFSSATNLSFFDKFSSGCPDGPAAKPFGCCPGSALSFDLLMICSVTVVLDEFRDPAF